MVKLNDHYFISWLSVVKKYEFVVEDEKVFVYMSPTQYTEALYEYNKSYKPILKEIRKVVKLLAALTSKSKTDKT
mgnify:CR=1 FL=1